ncbi:CPBP family intramembrane glutamic endopeptidase [Polaribacter sp.]|uniref:CPBP family intramembrane glutamic endopeptidase n=1 Tax=Polaribacter sp. TaxID=1920175 RepID=UPI0025E898BD|nr:CPBP family intramembrane glutamic endopeptidase [Polaribacter sp.]
MNYIQQAYKGQLGMWKYLIIPILFFGLMGLNFMAMILLDLDVEKIIQTEIENKGATRFLIESLIPFAVGLVVVLLWTKFVHQQSITSLTTSRKKIDWKRVLFAFLLWGTITTFFLLIDYISSSENYQWNFNLSKFLILLVIAIVLIPLQTSFEEYLFRGYLMQGLGVATKTRWVPLFFTSIVFGLLHISNPEVSKLGYELLVYYIGTGFFLGIITLMDEGLELALGFHAANNLFTALLVTSSWTVFQTDSVLLDVSEPTLGADVYVPVFVIFPLVLFVFSKKYKWSHWKVKLFGGVYEPQEIK